MVWQFNDPLFRTKGLKYIREHWDTVKYSDNLRDILNNSNVDCIEELFLVANGTNHLVRWRDFRKESMKEARKAIYFEGYWYFVAYYFVRI